MRSTNITKREITWRNRFPCNLSRVVFFVLLPKASNFVRKVEFSMRHLLSALTPIECHSSDDDKDDDHQDEYEDEVDISQG